VRRGRPGRGLAQAQRGRPGLPLGRSGQSFVRPRGRRDPSRDGQGRDDDLVAEQWLQGRL